MTRKSRPDLAAKEARMQSALKSWKANKKQSIGKLAKAYDVCRTTLNNRIKGRKSRREGRQNLQALSPAEENELIRWISKLTITGFSPPQKLVRQMAETIRNRRTRGINDASIRLIQYPPLGRHWVRNFIRRHPRLQTVVGQTIDASRIEGTRSEALRNWFDAYRVEVIEDPNVQMENVYNMDESGFSIGAIKAGRVVIDKELRTKFQAQPGRQEWVTVIECISAVGINIPSYVIFKGESVNTKWIPDNIPDGWRVAAGPNGWTSQKDGKEWLCDVFEPATREKADGKPRVLICDGHDSHVTGDFIEHCIDNNIKLLILPPHSSHFTQPLDIGIFSPLKEYMSQEIMPLISAKIATLRKVEWLEAYIKARERAFSVSNIIGSWNGAGLVPFNTQKVLRRVSSPTPTPPPISYSSNNPFDNVFISGSPVDIPTLNAANTALNDITARNDTIESPLRNYINHLTNRVERLETRVVILEKEKNDAEGILSARRKTESGKRAILKGRHSVAGREVLELVRAEEKRIEERKSKNKKKRPTQSSESLEINNINK